MTPPAQLSITIAVLAVAVACLVAADMRKEFRLREQDQAAIDAAAGREVRVIPHKGPDPMPPRPAFQQRGPADFDPCGNGPVTSKDAAKRGTG